MVSLGNRSLWHGAACRIVGAVLATSLGWPSLVEARPGVKASVAEARSNTELAHAPSPEALRLELNYPDSTAAVIKHGLLEGARLHLQRPCCELASDAPRRPKHNELLQRRVSDWISAKKPNPIHLSLWPEGELRTRKLPRSLPPQDERSAWARWHSTLWGTSATLGVAMFATVAALSYLPHDISGWIRPNFYGLKKNFKSGPSFDFDHDYFNYIFHPYDGSEFYLLARNRECTWWESFAYAAIVSSSFEFFIESAYEGASWQDLWITPVSGAVIGELRWQAKRALEDPKTGKPVGTTNKILHVLVDPVDAILNL